MSKEAIDQVWTMEGLSAESTLVMLAVAQRMPNAHGFYTEDVADLARMCKMHLSTMLMNLQLLAEEGRIEIAIRVTPPERLHDGL